MWASTVRGEGNRTSAEVAGGLAGLCREGYEALCSKIPELPPAPYQCSRRVPAKVSMALVNSCLTSYLVFHALAVLIVIPLAWWWERGHPHAPSPAAVERAAARGPSSSWWGACWRWVSALEMPIPSEFFHIRSASKLKPPMDLSFLRVGGISYGCKCRPSCAYFMAWLLFSITMVIYLFAPIPEVELLSPTALMGANCTSLASVSFSSVPSYPDPTAPGSVAYAVSVVVSNEASCRAYLERNDPCAAPGALKAPDASTVLASWLLFNISGNFESADAGRLTDPRDLATLPPGSVGYFGSFVHMDSRYALEECRVGYADICDAFLYFSPPYLCLSEGEWDVVPKVDDTIALTQVFFVIWTVFQVCCHAARLNGWSIGRLTPCCRLARLGSCWCATQRRAVREGTRRFTKI
jgi:hypothetical protein